MSGLEKALFNLKVSRSLNLLGGYLLTGLNLHAVYGEAAKSAGGKGRQGRNS
jgi:hypothetical protein